MTRAPRSRKGLGRRSVPLAIAALALTLGAPVSANGRFPRAQRLLEQGGPERLVLSATYGLLLTADRGRDWRHVCELGFAFSIDEFDPLVELPADGSLLVLTPRSLNRSEAPYCGFEPVLGGTAAETVADFSVDRGDRERVLALVRGRGDAGDGITELHESRDSGRTFEPIGMPLPASDVALGLTIDAAPSDPLRVYVTATDATGAGIVARSDDRGARWTSTALPLEPGEAPYLAAVHPTNPSSLYVRSDGWRDGGNGTTEADDALLLSEDGGETFREIHRGGAKLLGFALSPDGSELVIGYGDPVEPSRSVSPDAFGIFRASTTDHVFSRIFPGAVSCLAWTEAGVYACTSQAELGFALGFAISPEIDPDDPAPLAPLLDLREVGGPLDCPAESSGVVCQAAWADSCAVLGSCDAGAAQGAGGDAGAADGAPSAESEPSCGCRAAGSPDRSATWPLLLMAAIGLRGRRGRL